MRRRGKGDREEKRGKRTMRRSMVEGTRRGRGDEERWSMGWRSS
jgi:hypothetical protein